MTSIVWKVNRLRNMSLAEVLYRSRKKIRGIIERISWSISDGPNPGMPVGSKNILIPDVARWCDGWEKSFELETELLDDLIQGRLSIFGSDALDLGSPPNWHRDPITGVEAPKRFGRDIDFRDKALVGNIKSLWEINRHQHLPPLAVGYAITGNLDYRQTIKVHIDSWLDQNPIGIGINWCSSMELGLRLISWALVHAILLSKDGGDGLFDLVDKKRLGKSIFQHVYFITNTLSKYSSANNHLIGELTGIWVAVNTFDFGLQGDKWAQSARRNLEYEAIRQNYSDGVNKEQAFFYHVSVLDYFLLAWVIGKRSGRPLSDEFKKVMRSMSAFIRAVTPVGGAMPIVGDADDAFVTRFVLAMPKDMIRDVMTAADRCLGLADWNCDSQPGQKAFWYGVMLCDLSEGKQNESASEIEAVDQLPKQFSEGGYAILGDSQVHLLMDAGRLGYLSIAAHGHADALSFCLSVDGISWLVDPGIYSYQSDDGWRDYFRGTRAHSTVVLDRRNQSQIAGAFMWSRRANAEFLSFGIDESGQQYVIGRHDGYEMIGAECMRKITYQPDARCVEVTDIVNSSSRHFLEINFQFAPDVILRQESKEEFRANLNSEEGRELVIIVDTDIEWSVVRGQLEPKLGWYSGGLGDLRPTAVLHGELSSVSDLKLVTKFQI